MSFEIPTHFVDQFTTNVAHLLQQKGSKLASAMTLGSHTGKSAVAVEQVGAVSAQKRTTRHGDSPLISTPADRRWVFPFDYEWGDLIDDQDKLRMLIDPTSAYVTNASYALGRAKDDEILAALYGTAKTGESGSTNTTFPNAQKVGVDTGGTGTGMNIAKLRAAKKILMANEVDIDNDPLYCAITAEQHDDLLSETQAISLDYNTRPVLVDGRITAFMGFNFIHIEFTSSAFANAASMTASTGTTGNQFCPAWAKSGMHLGMWNDITTRISERADKSFSTYVYAKGTFGATRLEEGKVVQIACAV